ncbi:MAG: hypothetical protein IAE99_03340 [Rhodothermales bacterium]|nr:hypothetical protein [Rhodothermales bacterium]
MMDIVPILSTIILVATLATLVLAVIAYFLYKSRERKARAAAAERRDPVMAMPMMAADNSAYAMPGYAQPPAQPAYVPTMAALPAGPPMAVDTNRDGRMDALYAPTVPVDPYAMPVAQSYTARAAMPDPVVPVAPAVPVAPSASVAPGSMFYEYTQGSLVPPEAAPVAPTMANLGVDPFATQQAQLDAARMQANRAEVAAERQQERIDRAQGRLDAQRRRDDGLAWL